MKTKPVLKLFFLAVSLLVLASFVGCDIAGIGTGDSNSDIISRKGGPKAIEYVPEADAGEAGEVNWLSASFGYQSFTYGLWAGQNIEAGTVTISNDEENLYISVDSLAVLEEVHVYLYTDAGDLPSRRPAPGLAPYSAKNINDYSVELTIPIDDVEDGKTYYAVIHAALAGEEGDEYYYLNGETAYAGMPPYNGPAAWFYVVSYVITEVYNDNGGDNPNPVWEGETAWAGDTKGGGSAWWYYFDTEGNSEQAVYAGQKLVDGASVIYAGGKLTIVPGENMRLQEGNETVKIQGYNEIPASRPAAGQFSYKGNELTVDVDDFPFFAIHLDVEVKQD